MGKGSLKQSHSPAVEPVSDQSCKDALESLVMEMTAEMSLISVGQTWDRN